LLVSLRLAATVAYNATLLERKARAHLAAWEAHPEYQRFRRELPDSRPARLVIVAHSMGGLLTRDSANDLDIRATVTLATRSMALRRRR
jgi:alpha-beta hydrolase superfamily lysophospholipase